MSHDDPQVSPPAGSQALRPVDRWRQAFPFHWDADELVSRRDLLSFTVYASVTIFGATGLLALLTMRQRPPLPVKLIARTTDVGEGHAFYFAYPKPDDQAMLLHLPGGRFVAYRQRCTHLSCAVYYQPERDRLFCPCHEGVFHPSTGDPIAGPPQRRLERIVLRQEGTMLYAVAVAP